MTDEHATPKNELDTQLTEALRAVDAPAGFVDRVMARVGDGALAAARHDEMHDRDSAQPKAPTAKRRLFVLPARGASAAMTLRRRNPWLAGSIAAGLLLAGVCGQQAYEHHQRALAEQRFETSLRVEQQTLSHVRAQLAAAGVQVE